MFAIFLILLLTAPGKLKAVAINCENTDHYGKSGNYCYLDKTTMISETNVTIAGLENLDVNGISFRDNRKIKFLPMNVYKNFPNLEFYWASRTAVEEISSLSFKELSILKLLDLSYNNIEYVPDDCFQGLTKLQLIYLGWNKIKTVNGVAFANLPRLIWVDLRDNVCNDKLFQISGGSNQFMRKISRSCASVGFKKKSLSCSFLIFCQFENKDGNCCELPYETVIDDPDYIFEFDINYLTVESLYIVYQQNVEFLPILVHERFPRLRHYFAENTPITRILKKNFEKLVNLERLVLNSNRIEVIKSDTFEDLINLRIIWITDQPLLSLNSQAFTIFSKATVDLSRNHCIDDLFHVGVDSDRLLEEISKKCGFDEITSIEVACERFDDIVDVEFCVMTEKTAINATNFVIGELKDEEVEGIKFTDNKAVEYLPYKIHMQFPYLVIYDANNCSIKQITKENFEKLNSLREIKLGGNQIQKISANTFEGLEKVNEINLGKNQIKSINVRTFDLLPRLTSVDLTSNECIDEELKNGDPMKKLTRNIIQHCSFTEFGERYFEKIFDNKCGVGFVGSGLVVGGNEIRKGQWPFLAALMLIDPKDGEDRFFCGGNIITASHVLTAAHCIQTKNAEKSFTARQIKLLLGAHNLSRQAEVGSEIRGVKKIIVHPHWNPIIINFDGDIAVLEMDRAVQFSQLIQPVCLTIEPEISQLEDGYVIGWVKSESAAQHETVPRQVLIYSVKSEKCFEKGSQLGAIYAQGMLCAGGDRSEPCNYDSGGGFLVKYHGLWTLQGIVSAALSKSNKSCDLDTFTLFTNALDYTSWISKVTN